MSQSIPPIDRQKYMDILNAEGISSALTAIHRDMALVEYQAFEGDRRTEPALLQQLSAMRDFSREIWEIALRQFPAHPKA